MLSVGVIFCLMTNIVGNAYILPLWSSLAVPISDGEIDGACSVDVCMEHSPPLMLYRDSILLWYSEGSGSMSVSVTVESATVLASISGKVSVTPRQLYGNCT